MMAGSFISGLKFMCIGPTLFHRCFLQAGCLPLQHGRGLKVVQGSSHLQSGTEKALEGLVKV